MRFASDDIDSRQQFANAAHKNDLAFPSIAFIRPRIQVDRSHCFQCPFAKQFRQLPYRRAHAMRSLFFVGRRQEKQAVGQGVRRSSGALQHSQPGGQATLHIQHTAAGQKVTRLQIGQGEPIGGLVAEG